MSCGLNISEEATELLGCTLEAKNLLMRGTRTQRTGYNSILKRRFYGFCFDVDISKSEERILHNVNLFGSIPVAHLVHLKKSYDNLKTLLTNIYGQYVTI